MGSNCDFSVRRPLCLMCLHTRFPPAVTVLEGYEPLEGALLEEAGSGGSDLQLTAWFHFCLLWAFCLCSVTSLLTLLQP